MANIDALRKQEEYAKSQGVYRQRMFESFLHGGNNQVNETFMLLIGPNVYYTDPLCRESADGKTNTLLNVRAETEPTDVVYRTPCLLMYAELQVEGKVMQESKWIVDKMADALFPQQSLRFTNLQALEYYLQNKDAVDNNSSYGQDKTFQMCKEMAKADRWRVSKRQTPFMRPGEWNRFFDGLIKVRHRPTKEALVVARKLFKKVHDKKMVIPDVHKYFSKKSEQYCKTKMSH